jgi:nitrite reductase/ring-hydroxylating ferredoxin subunit
MTNRVPIANVSEIPPGGLVRAVAGRKIAVFRVDANYFAIDNTCPHRGGPLGEGTVSGATVTCPWHGWRFDLASGQCQSNGGVPVQTFPIVIEGDTLLVDLPDAESAASGDGECLVRFGAMGHIGRFRAPVGLRCNRGSRVVVRSSRGLELGELLIAAEHDAHFVAEQPEAGELVREMTDDDRAKERLLLAGQQRAFDACQQLLAERQVPVDLVDAEQLFDGETLVFYFLGDPPVELADVTNELAKQYEAHVQFRPFGAAPDGCGVGCGRESCGEGACGAGACGAGECHASEHAHEPPE